MPTPANNSGIRDNYRRGAAADFLRATFRRRVAADLQSGRDFVIPDRSAQANDIADFELITWLVIK